METTEVFVDRRTDKNTGCVYKNTGCVYIMGYYSVLKEKEIMAFTTVWIKLKGITVSEISQNQKDKYYMISLTCRT